VSNEEQVRANRIAAEGVREEQAVGLRTTIEVLNAEQELRNSELLLVQARRDNYLAGAALLSAMGRLEARNLLDGIPTYEPDESFRRIRRSGSVPWEPLIEKLDQIGAPEPKSRVPVSGETVATAR
jgi:outer membrane protein